MKINRSLNKFKGIKPHLLDFLDETLEAKKQDDKFPLDFIYGGNDDKWKALTITEDDLLHESKKTMTIAELLHFIEDIKGLDLSVLDKIDPVEYEAELNRRGGREHLREEFKRFNNFFLGE